MKTVKEIAEEMLERYTDTLSISNLVDDIVKIREEAYNQAIEDVTKSIKLKRYSLSPYDDTSDGYDLRETSIPPLYTRGFNGFINGKVEIDKESILKLKK